MIPALQAAVRELREQLQDLIECRNSHKHEATEAMRMYKERIESQRTEYLSLCTAHAAFQASGDATALESLISLGSIFKFSIDSDYQQDKATPFWGMSPQPGPTYFFSKETNYLHIANLHACGDADGPTRLARSYFYIRSQQCAGSKDCNDTVCTLFDILAAPPTCSCQQPALFRSGTRPLIPPHASAGCSCVACRTQ